MWHELDYNVAIALINWLPNHWYRVHAPVARLGYAFEKFAGVDHASFDDYLEGWMRPTDRKPAAAGAAPVFSPDAIADVDLAFDLGLLTQDALAALGPKRLRAAGAFARDRVTDTSIRGG